MLKDKELQLDDGIYFTWYLKNLSINIIEFWSTPLQNTDKDEYLTLCLM